MTTPQRILDPARLAELRPRHWQSRWEALYGDERVEQADWMTPAGATGWRGSDEVLLAADTPCPCGPLTRLPAGGELGRPLPSTPPAGRRPCWWPPPDTERPDMPPQLHNWKPIRRPRLPFASIAVVSTDDPYCSLERVTEFTQAWGSRVVVAGPRGHLNGDSGLGDWPEGPRAAERLCGT